MKNKTNEIRKNLSKNLIRNDINLEKWEIFAISKYKGNSREITHKTKNGELRITIGKTENGIETGVLNTYDGIVFYGLIKLWEKAGKPLGPVNFSLRQLAEILLLPDSSETYKFLRKHLERLRFIPIKFVETYKYKREENKFTVYYTMLSSLNLFERKRYDIKKAYFAFSTFEFPREMLRNLKEGYTKPLRLDVVKNLKTEIAFILYRYLDIIMYDKIEYDIDLIDVANICGLSANNPIKKTKQLVERALKELIGKELTSGIILIAELQENPGKPSGWQCYFTKSISKNFDLQGYKPIQGVEKIEQDIINHFKTLTGNNVQDITPKEKEFARDLYNTYNDINKIRYIIDYAVSEARKTNFNMRYLQAIGQYIKEGAEEWDKKQKAKQVAVQKLEQEKEMEERAKIEQQENEKLLEKYNSLDESKKSEIRKEAEERAKKVGDLYIKYNGVELEISKIMKEKELEH